MALSKQNLNIGKDCVLIMCGNAWERTYTFTFVALGEVGVSQCCCYQNDQLQSKSSLILSFLEKFYPCLTCLI